MTVINIPMFDAKAAQKYAKAHLRELAVNTCCLPTKDLHDVVVDAGRWPELLLAEPICLFEKQLHLLVKSLGAALHSKPDRSALRVGTVMLHFASTLSADADESLFCRNLLASADKVLIR